MKGENSGEDGAETEEEYDVCNSNEEDLVGDGSGVNRRELGHQQSGQRT